MSTINGKSANPLSRFRSYSYYHVLVVCDSTETADAISLKTDPSIWHHPSAPDPNSVEGDTFDALGGYAVKFLNLDNPTSNQAQVNVSRKGRYCVLINGSTDAALAITRAKWQALTAAQATVMDQSTSIAVEGEIEISEPKGVVFLDTIVNCCLALGIDAANAIFVLKTFFVGRPDSYDADLGGVEQNFINNVEPVRFIAYDITGSFSEAGGLYLMNFVAIAYGAARMPQYSKSAAGFSFTAGNTLASTIKILETRIAQNYDKLFNCVYETVLKSEVSDFAKRLTRINYVIELDPVYTSGEYQVSDTQPQSKDYAGCSDPSKLTFPANMSIEDAIHLIMRQCKQVQDDMATGSGDRNVHYEYKIHPAYISEKLTDSTIQHTIKYVVKRFQRPKDVNLFELAAEHDKNSPEQAELKKNVIEYNYIYTGKNIDVLEFDMKLNLGLQYLQIATITNTLKDQLQSTPSSFTHVPKIELEQLGRFGKDTQVPVMFGTQVKVPSMRNRQAMAETTEAGYSLNKHASIEVQDATMKIVGNPYMLSSMNRVTSPSNMATPSTVFGGVLPSWGLVPSFAKVNVRMPRHNDDIALFKKDVTGAKQNEVGFTKEFWFTGYYYIVGVEHNFEGGEFTQTLEMIGIPQSSATKVITKQGQTQSDLERQKRIASCYGDTVDPCACNQATGPVVGSQHVTPMPPANGLAYRDGVSVYDGNITPEQVDGYTSASPTAKNAIVTAANKHGIPPGHLVAIAASESNFKTNAAASTSTATGLFQFTKATWEGTNNKNGMVNLYGARLGIAGLPPDEQLAARTDPFISSDAAGLLYKENENTIRRTVGSGYTPTVYDMHLAHIVGGSAAGNVIKLALQGGDSASLLAAFQITYAKRGDGTQQLENVKAANQNLFGNATTVGEMRAAAARALNNRLAPVKTIVAQNTNSQSPQNVATSTGSQGTQPSSVTSTVPTQALASSKTSMTCEDKKAVGTKSSCNQTQKA